ncbi:hypothetical protein [Corynebacterium glucuronolyticum]|nr:hypothetical protein [Corynebacterium glucuronolyticum]WKD64412.1 hypothetical protein CGLUCO_10950 [Corynebacterium glucuronolyticum DSM 44120]SMB82955.1 hypothetical protein SAMN05660745_00948 [Corynebacterium glucuronolyticum]
MKTKPSLPVLATATAVALSTMMAPQATAAATTSDFTTSYDIVSGNCTVNYSRNAQRNIMSGYKDMGRKLADVRGVSNTKNQETITALAIGFQLAAFSEPTVYKPEQYNARNAFDDDPFYIPGVNQEVQIAVRQTAFRSYPYQKARELENQAFAECRNGKLGVIIPSVVVPIVAVILAALAWPAIKQAIPALQGLPF